MQRNYADFLCRTFLFVAVALLPFLVWYLFDVILMAFGAIILAMLVWLVAEPFMRWLSVREGVALAISGALILIILAGVGFLFGTRVVGQLQDVLNRATSGAAGLRQTLQDSDVGRFLVDHITGSNFSLGGVLASVLQISSSVIEGGVIAIISGIYLAAQPRLYRDGFIQLFPPRLHGRAAETIEAIGGALRLWMIGQLVQMVAIGTLATIALWVIGVPASLALGLIAGVGEFIPYLGPIVASIPAILVAFTKGPDAALWTVAAYLVINQIEGQLLVPLIQRYLVFIPPAVILLGVVTVTSLFGTAALIFAAPLTVVIFVAVKILYVRDMLGEQTKVPGE